MITFLEYRHRLQLFYGTRLRPWVLAYYWDPFYHGAAPDGSQPVISISNWDQVRYILPYCYRPVRVLSSGSELWPGPYFLTSHRLKFSAMLKQKTEDVLGKIFSCYPFDDPYKARRYLRPIILDLLRAAYQEGREDQMAEYIRDLDSEFH